GYCNTARDTWSLFKRVGVEALVNDGLVSLVILLAALAVGLVCAFFGFVTVRNSATLPQNAGMYAAVCIGFALVGFMLSSTLFEVVNSGVST
ncbi:putative choline transporter, neither null mutation nor overexpression affects choline transport, partial [Cladochytrium tenue]